MIGFSGLGPMSNEQLRFMLQLKANKPQLKAWCGQWRCIGRGWDCRGPTLKEAYENWETLFSGIAMKTEESIIPRRGNPRGAHNWNCENPALQSAGGRKGMKSKMDANLLDALWDESQARNRVSGPWGPTKR